MTKHIDKYKKILFLILLTLFLSSCNSNQPLIESNNQFSETNPKETNFTVEIYTENLNVPWDIEFINNDTALVTQRPGYISLIKNGKIINNKYYVVNEVINKGEQGLMGLAIHPEYPEKAYIYIMYTYNVNEKPYNKVIRLIENNNSLIFDKIIIDNILGARYHDGGRIEFGPDNKLYITTGDATEPELAQDINSLNGKILRLNDDGTIPKNNPYNNEIYSLGHRNPQGLTWQDNSNIMFQSEHGPSGDKLMRAHDEVNIIEKGKNYGWPEIIGRSNNSNYVNPLVLWAESAVPPGGIDFLGDSLYVASLRSEALMKIKLDENNNVISIERLIEGEYGRLRDVKEHEGNLYILTSNKDGRGDVRNGDDKILKVSIK